MGGRSGGRSVSGVKAVGHSLYGITVAPWLERFPETLVLRTEDLKSEPIPLLRRVEAHLGLPPHAWDPTAVTRRFNPSACSRTNGPHWINGVDRAGECRGSNNEQLDLPTLLEAQRPTWWQPLANFFGEPGHQLEGNEYDLRARSAGLLSVLGKAR